jgi:hypothetical protein
MNRREKRGRRRGAALTGGSRAWPAGPNTQDVPAPGPHNARAAAIQALPGGTAGRVEQETNEGAAYYGVTVTKTDGTKVEVHEDQNYHVLGTEAPDDD